MPIPDDARYGKDCSPQSRKEDVAYDMPKPIVTLKDEKEVDKAAGLIGSGTRGAADVAPAGD